MYDHTQTKSSKEKAKFRSTSTWKLFRQKLKKERKVDFVSQKPLRAGFSVHHCDLDPEHYDKLCPDNFFTLNIMFHRIVHEIYRYKDWESILARLAIVFRKMDELNNPNGDTTKNSQQELF